jgi:FkbM family methyltransferase
MLKSFLSKLNQSSLWRQRVKVWDSVYIAPTLDRLVSLHVHRIGWMGSAEKALLCSVVRHDSVVADVGANQGLYSLWLARVATDGHIYAFEPDPQLFQCLESNIRNNRLANISTMQAAVSNRSGTLAFAANELNRGDNRVRSNPDATSSGAQVAAVTIDEIFGSSRLDLLKIDVQGFEIEVLLGAQKTLTSNPDLTIAFEYWPYGLRQNDRQPGELLELLQEAGFSIAMLGRNGRLNSLPQDVLGWERATQYCNLIASRQRT